MNSEVITTAKDFSLVCKKETEGYTVGKSYFVRRYGVGCFDAFTDKGCEWDKFRFPDEESLYDYFYTQEEVKPEIIEKPHWIIDLK